MYENVEKTKSGKEHCETNGTPTLLSPFIKRSGATINPLTDRDHSSAFNFSIICRKQGMVT